jgi:hypothetical protein
MLNCAQFTSLAAVNLRGMSVKSEFRQLHVYFLQIVYLKLRSRPRPTLAEAMNESPHLPPTRTSESHQQQ